MRSGWWIAMAGFVLLATGSWAAAADVRSEADNAALDQRIAKLIEQLGDGQFSTRQRAQQELVKLGFDAYDALCDAENSDDPEIATQAAYLVRLIRSDWTNDDDPRPIQLILKDYEAQTDERRLLKIKQLAELPGDQGLEWLCKLVRFEKSQVLSKQAALAIMDEEPAADEAAWTQRASVITKTLGRARRPAAKWLLTDLQAHADPGGASKAWAALADDDRRTLEQHPQETNSQIVMELLRHKIDLLDRLQRPAEVEEVLHQMVLCERGDSASLTELVDWLVKRKAWNVIDEVATRFAANFDIDALLLYTLCEARLAQGNRELAEQTAEKALKLSGEGARDHVTVVERLMDRGLTEWSDRELKYIISIGPVASPDAVNARSILSDSLHDRGRDREAGDALKGLTDAMDADANVLQQIRQMLQPRDKKPSFLRARMYFYYACHAASEKDAAEQRKLLDKAVEQEPTDLDVLIAMYRLPDDDPARRANLMKMIKTVVDECRSSVDDAPDDATGYNEFAWLVANTEGDIDEAIRLSQKSVELVRAAATSPSDFKRVGQFLDTLAHCYFAKKDYANAVKCQTEAVKLDPHSQAISRQLKVFRDALAAQQAGAK